MATASAPQSPEDDKADFGNFVSNEDEQIDLENIAEPWHNYDTEDNSRVFYPIRLGEVLNERYLVEHKIGFGGFLTVWMAHDLQDKRDVALKVMCLGDWAETEIRMQDKIIHDVQDTSHLVTYLTIFLLPRPGDNGHHRVLVFPLMGPCLDWYAVKEKPMATRMFAARLWSGNES